MIMDVSSLMYENVSKVKTFCPRTLEEFVDSMIARGRSLKLILAVASATRWKNSINEIKEMYNVGASKQDKAISS